MVYTTIATMLPIALYTTIVTTLPIALYTTIATMQPIALYTTIATMLPIALYTTIATMLPIALYISKFEFGSRNQNVHYFVLWNFLVYKLRYIRLAKLNILKILLLVK